MRILTNTKTTAINQTNGRVDSVTVSVGGKEERLKADVVLLATGAKARTEAFPREMLLEDGSVRVNQFMQTSDPDIYAGGDIATFYNPYLEHANRIEHWAVAQDMGRLAALNMIGRGHTYNYVPFFWTNQFGNVTFLGSSSPSDSSFTEKNEESDPAKATKATYFFLGPRVIGLALIGRFVAPRMRFAFERGLLPSKAQIVSGAVKLDDILARVEATRGGACGLGCGR